MKEGKFWCLAAVSDAALQEGLKELLTKGARTEARIVAHLAEVDARKLHLSVGASSLFDYCLSRLGLSNSEAFHRITAARLARRFPIIFELLERRDVHLTAVCLLRDYLTPENHHDLLRDVSHKTRIEIEELLAGRFPKADVPNRLSRQRAFEPLSEGRYCLQLSASNDLKRKLELARDLMSHANPSGDLAVVVERALDTLIEKLQSRRFAQAKSRGSGRKISAGSPPGAGAGAGAGAGGGVGAAAPGESQGEQPTRPSAPVGRPSQTPLEVLGVSSGQRVVSAPVSVKGQWGLAQGAGGGHGKSGVAAAGETVRRAHLRNDVRRAVVARDGQRCSFVGEDGRRCESRTFLEFHHQRAWALGGADSAENLSVMCRAHNRLLAERELGAARIARAIQRNSRT
jgi:hypothetical protein